MKNKKYKLGIDYDIFWKFPLNNWRMMKCINCGTDITQDDRLKWTVRWNHNPIPGESHIKIYCIICDENELSGLLKALEKSLDKPRTKG